MVAAPSEKYIYVIQVKGEGKMEKTEIKDPINIIRGIERPKILDLAIYFIEKEKKLLIFVLILKAESPDSGNAAQKQVHRLTYSDISGIQDIVDTNRRHKLLFWFDCRDSVREDTKIALGFDKNPYEEFDARPTRIYVGRTRNKTRMEKIERNERIERNEIENVIEIYDMADENVSSKAQTKVVSKVNENKENKLEGISVSYHDRLKVAIAYQNSVALFKDIDKVDRKTTYEAKKKREISTAGNSTNSNLIAWHPTREHCLCSVSSTKASNRNNLQRWTYTIHDLNQNSRSGVFRVGTCFDENHRQKC